MRLSRVNALVDRLLGLLGGQRLRTQVLLAVTIVLAFLAAIYSLNIDRRMSESGRDGLARQAAAIASSIAIGSIQSLVTRDYGAIEQSLLALTRFPGLNEIIVADAGGIIISAVRATPGQDPTPDYGMLPVKPPRGGAGREEYDDSGLTVWQPVVSSKIIGWVRVRFDLGDINRARHQWRVETAAFAFAALLATTLALWHILARAMQPLSRVVSFARGLPKNVGRTLDASPSSVEIDELVRAFNQASRTLAEQYAALERSEALTAGILHSSMDAVITFDREGRILSANRATLMILGYSIPEAGAASVSTIPAVWQMLSDQSQAQAFRTEIHNFEGESGSFVNQRVECRMLHQDGTGVSTEMVVTCIDNTRSRLYAANIRDIEERRVFEQAIVERNDRLNLVLELSPDGFVMINREGRVGYANPAFCAMTGLHPQEVELLSFEELTEVFGGLCETGADGLGFANIEDLMGRTGKLSVLSRPERRVVQMAAERRAGSAVLCMRDVTRETEVDRMKSQFLSSAAHELRTPMVSVLGFTELLLKRRFDEARQKTMLETVHRQAKLLVGLINELLDLARIEARRGADFKMQPHDFRDIIRDTAAGFMAPSDSRQIMLVLPDQEAPILADGDKLRQALTNLISNAFKYSPDGGEIVVRLTSKQQQGVHFLGVSVRDQGIGMTPDQLAHAFERFYRADTSGNIPGTGLGLSLVKEIVQFLHGHVSLDSVHGQGTEAVIWLPQRVETLFQMAA